MYGEPPRRDPDEDAEAAAEALAEEGQAGEDAAAGDEGVEDAPEVSAEDDEESTSPEGSGQGERKRVDETTLRNEGAELLNDIPLQIAVELARIPVSADQVVSLRVGQVLDLNRVPGEPVELSVNGKVVARGELVEVEGHIGVRILSMAG